MCCWGCIQIRIRVWAAALGPVSLTGSFNQGLSQGSAARLRSHTILREQGKQRYRERKKQEGGVQKRDDIVKEERGGKKRRPHSIIGNSMGEVVCRARSAGCASTLTRSVYSLVGKMAAGCGVLFITLFFYVLLIALQPGVCVLFKC